MIPTPENLRLLNEVIEKNYGGTPRTPEEVKAIAKTDAPILSSTTGYYNVAYGAYVFQQLNNSSALFNALPKFNYERSGYRVFTTRFKNSGVGVSENASIPSSVKPTAAQVNVGIKEMAIAIEYSERMRLLSGTKDDAGFDLPAILQMAKDQFIYAIDTDMNEDVTNPAGSNIESIDRVVSSYSERANCPDVDVNDADIYGLDRDAAASWYDAYVNHNSGNARSLTDSLIRQLIRNTRNAGANPATQFFYTGYDTYDVIMGLYQSQIRYFNPDAWKPASNVNTGETSGVNFGLEAGKLYGIPIYVAPAGKVTANGEISNLYLLDAGFDPVYNAPYLGIKILQAPIIAETTLRNYPAHQKLGNEHVLYAAMELECRRFNIQGKLRDLKA